MQAAELKPSLDTSTLRGTAPACSLYRSLSLSLSVSQSFCRAGKFSRRSDRKANLIPHPFPSTLQPLTDISSLLSKGECYCLNEKSSHPHTNLFIGDNRLGLMSDADEQLMIHLQFNETVKVHSLTFLGFDGAGGGVDVERSPRIVKVFVNRPSMGFSDAEDVIPTEEFELTEEEIGSPGGVEKVVRFVKFQRVTSLSVFVEENFGGEESALGGLKIHGGERERERAKRMGADRRGCLRAQHS